jgi:ATP-dependent DNA helicase RecQ
MTVEIQNTNQDNTEQNTAAAAIQGLQLDAAHLVHLPPEVRDRLLKYLADWGSPGEQLQLVEGLREAHGPLLFLLDYQARALFQHEEYERALEVIERRQRRSTTIASQAMEAKALLAAGYEEHALDVVADISQAYPRDITAIGAAAEVYGRLGRFPQARELLEAYLDHRAGDLQATLLMARLAHEASESALMAEYMQRLGPGIPAGITNPQLQEMGALYDAMGNQESANAVQIELERRRQQQLQELRKALAPFTQVDDALSADPAALYRHLSGPESIEVSRQEKRNVQLEAVRHFGFMKLRTGQMETIAAILRGESILAVMPTGAGKSLCYQLPALTLPKATLVISPLIALMKDQVESLPAAARPQATFVNSTLEDEELQRRMAGIAQGEYKLIYAAPERLRQRSFLRALREGGLDLFVVDEAHCVSLWGHDFRPDYLFIQEARRELGNPTALAMTATAPPAVRDEIVDYMVADSDGVGGNGSADGADAGLGVRRPRVLTLDIFRDNLHLSALRFYSEDEKLAALLKFVKETEGSGIVYVNSRAKSESLAFELREIGVSAEAYHAGLADRGAVQDRFMSDKTRVVVATIAFGMGIDKSDIRFIVHFHPSRSLAAYYQEVGRAGRDGKPSQGVMFYSNNDWANLRRWAKSDEFTVEFLERIYAAVATQLGVRAAADDAAAAEGDGAAPPSRIDGFEAAIRALDEPVIGVVDPRRLQQVTSTDETTMRVAISTLERADLLSREFDLPRELEIRLPRKLPAAAKKDEEFAHLLKGLSLKPGKSATFKTADVANFMGWLLHETESLLLDWQAQGYLTAVGSRRAMLIELTPQPEGTDVRERLQRLLTQSAALAQRRIDDIIGYSTTETCRHGYISTHFGSPPRSECDVCDNCTGVRPDIPPPAEPTHPLPDDADIEPMIIDCLISLPKPVGRSGLARVLTGSLRAPVKPNEARHHGRLKALGEAMIMNYVDSLLDDNRLRQYQRQGYSVLAPTMRGRAEAEAWLEEHPELADYGATPEPEAEEEAETETTSEGDKYTALQKALWNWRRRTAEQMGQPPYVIMSNELMLRIAETRPQDEAALAALPGMGTQRLEHYGPTILDLVQLHPPEDGDEELMRAQRENQAEVEKKVQSKVAAEQRSRVSPRVERRIFMKMQELRQKLAVQQDSKPYLVAGNAILKSIAQSAPASTEDLHRIVGFRSSGLSDEAEQILQIVAEELGQG